LPFCFASKNLYCARRLAGKTIMLMQNSAVAEMPRRVKAAPNLEPLPRLARVAAASADAAVFGRWQNKNIDGLAYQEARRAEW
jgi:hypothetical protein